MRTRQPEVGGACQVRGGVTKKTGRGGAVEMTGLRGGSWGLNLLLAFPPLRLQGRPEGEPERGRIQTAAPPRVRMPSYASLSATSRTSVPGECGEAALAVQPENKSRERSVAQGVSASWIAGVRPAASEYVSSPGRASQASCSAAYVPGVRGWERKAWRETRGSGALGRVEVLGRVRVKWAGGLSPLWKVEVVTRCALSRLVNCKGPLPIVPCWDLDWRWGSSSPS